MVTPSLYFPFFVATSCSRWCSLVVFTGGVHWWCSLVVFTGGVHWWCSLVVAALSLYSLCCGVCRLLLEHYTLQCSTPCKTVTAVCCWGLSDDVNTVSLLSLICCSVQLLYNSDSSVFLAVPTGGSNIIFFTLSVLLVPFPQHYTLQCSTPCKTVTAVCSWGLSDDVNTVSLLSLICCCVQHGTTVCFGWHPLAVVTSSSSPCLFCCSVQLLYNSDSSVFLAVPTGGSNIIFFTLSVVPLQCSTQCTTVTAVCSWQSLLAVVTPSSSPCLFCCSVQLCVQQRQTMCSWGRPTGSGKSSICLFCCSLESCVCSPVTAACSWWSLLAVVTSSHPVCSVAVFSSMAQQWQQRVPGGPYWW